MTSRRAPIWIFGNAVQDITVDVDLDRLSRERADARDLIRLDQAPELKSGLLLKTRKRASLFTVQIRLTGDANTRDGFHLLKPGGKYTLDGDICESVEGADESVFVPCDSLSWGGGGLNVASFLRALAPDCDQVPVRYTDVAMNPGLSNLLERLHYLIHELEGEDSAPQQPAANTDAKVRQLRDTNPSRLEELARQVAQTAAQYTPDRSLEVYLASLPVDSVLYRPKRPRFRRNWVFSRIHTINRDTENKIICRGASEPLADAEEPRIQQLLNSQMEHAGAFLLNSVRDAPLFRAAYSAYRQAYSKNNKVVGMLAMTEAMQAFTDWLVKDKKDNDGFPPFILIFNESEAAKFAQRFDARIEPFMKGPDDLPNIRLFGQIAVRLQQEFPGGQVPRMYVTLGSRGSLGVGEGHVVYVSCFSKPRATIYDTNACGDAFAAAILLLEWAKRNGYEHIAGVDDDDSQASAKEMAYFMAVATAASYCKATNRRGEVDQTEVVDLLEYGHLASTILASPRELAEGKKPRCVDSAGRLRVPPNAQIISATAELKKLMGLA